VARQLKRATTTEQLSAIARLRYSVYVVEQQKQYPAADHRLCSLPDAWDRVSAHWLVSDDDDCIAAVRYTALADAGWGMGEEFRLPESLVLRSLRTRLSIVSRLVVRAPERFHLRELHGLFVAVYEHGLARGDVATCVHCALPLQGLFERVGFQAYGDSFELPGSGRLHQPMILFLDDHDRFRAARSPLARVLLRATEHSDPIAALVREALGLAQPQSRAARRRPISVGDSPERLSSTFHAVATSTGPENG